MYTPTQTIPSKSHLEEGLGAFSIRGNRHRLSHRNSKIVSGMTYFSSMADGRILLDGVPPTGYHRAILCECALFFVTRFF